MFEQVDVRIDQQGYSVPLNYAIKSRSEFDAEVFLGGDHFEACIFRMITGSGVSLLGLKCITLHLPILAFDCRHTTVGLRLRLLEEVWLMPLRR